MIHFIETVINLGQDLIYCASLLFVALKKYVICITQNYTLIEYTLKCFENAKYIWWIKYLLFFTHVIMLIRMPCVMSHGFLYLFCLSIVQKIPQFIFRMNNWYWSTKCHVIFLTLDEKRFVTDTTRRCASPSPDHIHPTFSIAAKSITILDRLRFSRLLIVYWWITTLFFDVVVTYTNSQYNDYKSR